MSGALLSLFLTEARELIQQASDDLLALERDPDDADRIGRVFRAFHTLKGSAALFDFGPLTATLHAAEDLLSALQEGRLPGGARDAADPALDCLDQVTRWLSDIEADGELPGDAPDHAAELVARLRRAAGQDDVARLAAPSAAPDLPDWVAGLSEAERAALRTTSSPGAATALVITYEPDPDCFFRGEDPLGLIRHVAGLAFCRIEPRDAWPHLAELDAFRCNLRIHAIAVAPAADLAAAQARFRPLGTQAQLLELPLERLLPVDVAPARPMATGAAFARAVLDEQRRMLAVSAGQAARVVSAARVAANALRFAGDAEGAMRVEASLGANPAFPDAASVDRAIAEALRPRPQRGTSAPTERMAGRVLRVDPAKVDRLVALADEMVLARNALQHLVRQAEAELGAGRDLVRGLKDQHAIVERLAREWHEAAVRMRMVPVRDVFRRFPRLVRELSRQLGKSVELVIEGEETEADKDVVDSLFEPLLHLLRNSLDHGIETPEERRGAGKRETALLVLRAFQEADRVVIEVVDDGRGVDAELVRRRAVQRGIIGAEQAATLSESEVVELVFASGVSTAEEISNVSGRGVGMDAVRAAAERVGGAVAIQSRRGQGTTIRLALPLSVTLAQILTVTVDDQVFALPLDAVVESVRLPRRYMQKVKNGATTFALDDRIVPLISLRHALGLQESDSPSAEEEVRVVVVEADGQEAGLEVDGVGERLDVILRPLTGLLAGTRGYLGTTLLGSGRVTLVLDVREMLR